MNHTSDFDNLNSRSLFDTDLGGFFREKTLQQVGFAQNDFPFAQRRERIDSEDFVLPLNSSVRKDTDFFVAEFHAPKITVAEEAHMRRKSSIVADSTLLELEVSSGEVHFESPQPNALSRSLFAQLPPPPTEAHRPLRRPASRHPPQTPPPQQGPQGSPPARLALRSHQAQRPADHRPQAVAQAPQGPPV